MSPDDDDERLLEPQEAADAEHEDHAQQLEAQERDEDNAEADFEDEIEPEGRAAHYQEVIGRMQGIFRGNEFHEDELEGLSADEKAALHVLAEAVRGTELEDEGDMIYAENRLTMLNQALAVLQPTLALGLAPELAELRGEYDLLVEEVTALRDYLLSKEDAEEEMFAQDREVEQAEGGDTDDDGDDDEDKNKKPDLDRLKTQANRARKAAEQRAKARPVWPVPEPGEPPRPSELSGRHGDPPVEQPPRPSTLAGKPGEPAVEQPRRPSTAYDGDK